MQQNSPEFSNKPGTEASPLLGFEQPRAGYISRLRQSKRLVLIVVCILLMLDVMLITALEPLLPVMLYELDRIEQGGITWSAWAASLFSCGQRLPGNGTTLTEEALYAKYAPQVGLVLGLKPGIEVIGNLIVGPLVDRTGHKLPLIFGSVLYMLTACMFALSPNFPVLVTARILQAISSSLSTVSGLALLASTFRDEEERSRASSIAFGGLSFGLIMGFPFGAIVAQVAGRASPFLILSAFSAIDAALRLLIKSPDTKKGTAGKETQSVKVLWRMATNKYIGTVLLADFFIHFALGTIFTTIPSFMQDRLGASLWQMAVVTFVATGLQFTCQFICTSKLTRNPLHRWRFLFPSLTIFSLAQCVYSYIGTTRVIWFALLPECILRIAMGVFTSTCFPTLNFLVDQFFDSEYGAVNGLYTGVFNLGMFCGSQYAGYLFHALGFDTMYHVSALLLLFASCAGLAHKQLAEDIDMNSERLKQSLEDSLRVDSFAQLVHSSASGSVL